MLKTGARLRSQVCTTEVIVVRADNPPATLNCGGHPLIDIKTPVADDLTIDSNFADGSALGKRYRDSEGTVEILVTKPGSGSLALGDQALELKTAQPLPSSD
ncbi:hypothetical protein SAMN02745947_05069 [Rhodococcus rhodochrous J3]|uniref:Uncharacterized protein n=2 Tax=Rhodococcus rhodochrous TaxID=1829 RepID=A0AA47ADD1_RHORH|nr:MULTISPECIES: hypothetical protein [Rhodococcus]MBF4478670.1 hypothetical protein [Rhodococcus rhodochrous]MCD2100195.1 hypothetical protein [Rhodococcus rhodochrous]MCD2124553.1 hypothetical protein [Rhodococcus rhodochrous]MCQ4137483.1 hypothetical protein [Rhodococcus rhodochrous]MDJ0021325.1 hypothetical protein [Rhodococcus rhodochrous]